MDAIPFDINNPFADVDETTLRTEISTALGVQYLSLALNDNSRATVDGIIFGRFRRVIFPLVIGHKSNSFVVHFIVVTGSPRTYLSLEVCGVHNQALHY
jgi:hypothetical protein